MFGDVVLRFGDTNTFQAAGIIIFFACFLGRITAAFGAEIVFERFDAFLFGGTE